MAPILRNITLGTAGHIDHGKTALVKLLTGCDTDRLKEEKERGMSIELGFAPCVLDDLEVGIVDVPGHEHFIKTMVAGAASMDAVLLVIAADDGIMPQTREHLDILTLLGIRHGFVALTKIDLVTPDRRDQVTGQIRDLLQGTFLEDRPIMPVSNVTGQGLGEFYDSLKALVSGITPKPTDGVFRLPVERAFSVKGYGTVVSGVPVAGKASIGDEVVLLPAGTRGRIKTLQVYQHSADAVLAGQCAALNVPQFDYHSATRGDVVTLEGLFQAHPWYLCRLKVLPGIQAPLKNGMQVKFHTGTSETPGVVFLASGSLAPGQEALVQIRADRSLVAGPNDRFILRMLTPVRTIGGGTIVEGLEEKLRTGRPEVLADIRARAEAVQNESSFTEYTLRTAPCGFLSDRQIALRTKALVQRTASLVQDLIGQGKVVALDGCCFAHTDTLTETCKKVLACLAQFHAQAPASPGMEREALLTQTHLAKGLFEAALRRLIADRAVIEAQQRLALAGHRPVFTGPQQQRVDQVEQALGSHLFAPPSPADLVQALGIPIKDIDPILRLLVEHGRIVRVDRDLYFHRDAVDKARTLIVQHIAKTGRLESVDFKYLVDTSRKYALPLLDYFDKAGVTRRAPDNTRTLGPKAGPNHN